MKKAQWIPVGVALPPKDKLVLARGGSGYSGHTEFFTAAYFNVEHRPYSPWLDPTNTCLSDRGWEPTHWRYLDDLIPLEEPTREKPKGPPNEKVVEGRQPPKNRKDIWNFDD